MAQRNQIADRYRKDMQRVHTAKFLRIEASNHCRADPGEADYLRELIRRAMSEEGAVSLTAWKEWEALPVGLRIQWWERRRFLYRWTAALLFAVQHAILSRVFTGWHVVKVDAQIGRDRALAAGPDTIIEGDSSSSAGACAMDGDAD